MGKEEAYWEWNIFWTTPSHWHFSCGISPYFALHKSFPVVFSAVYILKQLSGYRFPMYIFELMWSNTNLKKTICKFDNLKWHCDSLTIWQSENDNFGLVHWATNLTAQQKQTTGLCFKYAVLHDMLIQYISPKPFCSTCNVWLQFLENPNWLGTQSPEYRDKGQMYRTLKLLQPSSFPFLSSSS